MSAAVGIPAEDVQRMASRLRMLADEIESAHRYGVPIPYQVTVSGHRFGRATFPATSAEFDAWADYCEAEFEEYVHEGKNWRSATVDVNGLPLNFSASDGA